jgi:hypothetical protein
MDVTDVYIGDLSADFLPALIIFVVTLPARRFFSRRATAISF